MIEFNYHVVQAISVVGALLALIAYSGHQMGFISYENVTYNMMNVFGSSFLLFAALHQVQIGVILMESVWLIVSVRALGKRFKPSEPQSEK